MTHAEAVNEYGSTVESLEGQLLDMRKPTLGCYGFKYGYSFEQSLTCSSYYSFPLKDDTTMLLRVSSHSPRYTASYSDYSTVMHLNPDSYTTLEEVLEFLQLNWDKQEEQI